MALTLTSFSILVLPEEASLGGGEPEQEGREPGAGAGGGPPMWG